jgi:predicted RNA-binding protein with TRAM domain
MDGADPLCLFTGRVEERADAYVLEIPKREVELGTIHPDAIYRVGLYPGVTTGDDSATRTGTDAVDSNTTNSPAGATRGVANGDGDGEATGAAPPSPGPETASADGRDGPPVSEGETARLQIEDVGDQGDGLARVGPGYVVFVPDSEVGQQPLVRVTAVHENFAFAEIVKP